MDVTNLKHYLSHHSFDRIEVSNTIDLHFLGVASALSAVEPLLSESNKHATIVGLFMNALHLIQQTHLLQTTSYASSAIPFFDLGGIKAALHRRDHNDPVFLQIMMAKDKFSPFDAWYSEYEARHRVNATAFSCGLMTKGTNTVVEKWPWRLKKQWGQSGAQKAFDELFASGPTVFERYVEWKRF